MKKFAIMVALALPLAFASCGDDNDTTITLDQTAVNLEYGKSVKVKASEGGVAWGSSNEFVATVNDKGEIEAEHVGTAVITATKNGATAKCTVTVTATNNNFTLPILNWGASVNDVKSAVETQFKDLSLLTGSADGLTYTQPAQAYPWYLYIFKNGGLAGSMLAVDEDMDESLDLEGFIEQRYEEVDETEEGFVYVNANTIGEATLAVIYSYDADLEAVTATWMLPEHTKAGIYDKMVVRDLKTMLKGAKK
ncbi:MAG: Ig-like domain-containing protein [Muribaculaceae bacterium]|nr:Ig-like domain-containing protein [Muribaculaceae bacterium]